MTTEETNTTPLNPEQLARAEALTRSRAILRGGGINASPVEVTDLHALAVFILDGGDPWVEWREEGGDEPEQKLARVERELKASKEANQRLDELRITAEKRATDLTRDARRERDQRVRDVLDEVLRRFVNAAPPQSASIGVLRGIVEEVRP